MTELSPTALGPSPRRAHVVDPHWNRMLPHSPQADGATPAERYSFKVAQNSAQILGRKSGKVAAKWARD